MKEDSGSSADEDMESFCGDSDCNNDNDMDDGGSDWDSDSCNDIREDSDGTKDTSDDNCKREANCECTGLSQEVLHISILCKAFLAIF